MTSLPIQADASRRPPRPPDPSQVRRLANDQEALDAAHRLADQFAPGASERDRQRRLPWDELACWSMSGLGGITVPRAHGGAAVSFATLAEVFVVLSAADPAIGQIPQNHFGVLGVLREVGIEAQKQRFYAEVLAGRRLGNAGPERRSRTILHGQTRLRQTPHGLRLSGERFYATGALFAHRVPTRALDGHKFYCTGALFAHWIPTLAATLHDDREVTVLVFVPRRAQGVSITDDWDGFGQRVTGSGSVAFDAVAVQPDWVVPFLANFDRPTTIGPFAQLLHAAIDPSRWRRHAC